MKLISFFLVIMLVLGSCRESKPVNAPQQLISQDKMAVLIAEFAVNDQLHTLNAKGNMEQSTRFILKQHQVTAPQFSESYQYYLSSPRKLESILKEAQDIIKQKDPEAEQYIEQQLKPRNEKTEESAPLLKQ